MLVVIMPLFKEYARLLICGRSGSGKSTLVQKIIENHRLLFTTPNKRILYVSPSPPTFSYPNMVVSETIPDEIEPQTLVIIDDYMLDKDVLKQTAHLCIKTIHHSSSNLIFITQKFFVPDPMYRLILDNVTGILIFRQTRGFMALHRLASELFPKELKPYFWKTYHECTSRPYGYLYIDTSGEYPVASCLFSELFGDQGITQWVESS
jgi:hypothetical protein